MHELKVLAARLADQARVRQVVVHLVRNLLPQVLEDVSRTREVQPGKHAVRDDLVDELDRRVAVRARQELNHVLGQASLEQDLQDDPRRVRRHRRGFPHENVADERRSSDEVTSDRREAVRNGARPTPDQRQAALERKRVRERELT